MGNPSKMRASLKDGVVEVKALMQHAMENGRRKDEAGNLVPAWYITDAKFQHGDRTVLEIQFGTPVSKNPLMGFRFKGAKAGDKLTLSWVDNRGDKGSDTVQIS